MLTRLNSLCLAEDENTRNIHLALQKDGLVPAALWQVTLTRQREIQYPATSTYLVIAPTEEEAISQVEVLAFPEMNGCVINDEQRLLLSATACRVHVHIRGWGVQTF